MVDEMGADRRPSFVDLFAGCGGITRGFVDAGFKLERGYELAPAAAATFAANFGTERTSCVDLTKVTEVPRVDVVVGGPPCQGFSSLGKRDPADERNKLWNAYVDVVVASECDLFVFENVDRFAKSAEYLLLRDETLGGRLDGWVLRGLNLNAADFGVAQRRVRSVVVGSRIGEVTPPRHTHGKNPTDDEQPWATLADVIGHLDLDVAPGFLDGTRQFDLDAEHSVRGPYKLDELHVGRTYRPISLRRYTRIAPGRNRHALPDDLQMECWKKHKGGSADVLGRLEWEKPSVTIRTEFFKPEKGRYLHPEWSSRGKRVNRALTHAEAALIQGFDDRHVWCGSKIEIAKQIGNAVPPPLAEVVARQLLPVLASREPAPS
jgi:DNA (cytosine-5)-methyltransferase 1